MGKVVRFSVRQCVALNEILHDPTENITGLSQLQFEVFELLEPVLPLCYATAIYDNGSIKCHIKAGGGGVPFQSLPTGPTAPAFGAKLFASNFPSFPFDEARDIEPARDGL